MVFGLDQKQLLFMLLVAVAAGGGILALALPFLGSSESEIRMKQVTAKYKTNEAAEQSLVSRLVKGETSPRRRQVQETLKKIDEKVNPHKRGVPLRVLIGRSGLTLSVQKFWLLSGAIGLVMGVMPLLFGLPSFIGVLSGIAGLLGLPRWVLSIMAKRQQKAFLEGLADAVDVMVRGLKAGLPLTDAMRVIATEAEPPLGPEFMEVVEGQRLGITIDQGLERMFDRIPLPEVSFLGIVISIQSKAGGNLSEALANLSRVLRERKKLKAKVRSMSQEAKSSAAIIGFLPFGIIGAIFFVTPQYLEPLFTTSAGHFILLGCGAWMFMGIMVMRKMINFDV